MNILIFSWRGPKHPNFGGAEIVTHEHAKAWIAAGHSVTLFTAGFPGVPREETIDGIQIVRRGNQIASIQLAAIYWYLFSSHPKYDLVVDQFHGIPFFTPLYVGCRKMALIHEVAKEVWWINHLKFPIKYLYALIGYILEPLSFLLYRSVPFMTVSQSTKNDLVNWFIPEKNISVIHNGITTIPVKISKEIYPTLVFLGAIAQDKGIEDALKVFSRLFQSNQSWKFWVIGRTEFSYLGKLKTLTEQLHIMSVVKFWGFVDEPKKFELLARAHVMINTSYREGWGLVNIEANSVGTPVVAYDVPGCRDSIRDGNTGILCPRGDFDCMAREIGILQNDTARYQLISNNAKDWSRDFTWEKSTQASLNLIQRIVSGNTGQH